MSTDIEAVQKFLAWKEDQALTVTTDIERYEEHLHVQAVEAKLAEIRRLLKSADGVILVGAIEEVLDA